MTTEKHIKAFLESWLEWAEGNAIHDKPFSCRHGLCDALFEYNRNSRQNCFPLNEVRLAMGNRLIERNGQNPYPFGDYGYRERCKNFTQHLCQKRLSFVKDWLKELEHVA